MIRQCPTRLAGHTMELWVPPINRAARRDPYRFIPVEDLTRESLLPKAARS